MTIQNLLKTAPVTALLLVSFIGLFIMQVLTGVDINNPSTEALLKWGANALPFTMGDQPWRLVSSAFLHIGLMHLLFNGFAMYFFGQVAEPMFGSAKFLALFLLAAIGGNLLNNHVTWLGILDGTGQPGLSAGASGGIMGIGAALLIAALFKISVNGMVLNLKSLVFIMGINLVYGFAVPGIDNAGHIGGAITGLVIALGFAVAHRHMAAKQQAIPSIPIYQNRYPTEQTDDIDAPIGSHTDSDMPMDSTIYPYHVRTVSAQANISAKPAVIWRLLPWIVMLVITLGFIWWWQDIHWQIIEILKTIE
ncbi:rhomboid family intramembrane serine protease [Psychrobacter sp. F1192]|uniref:Rhomboid family intramembrane serine protease n=1 Tax=Psychrobacter coccoides TaxID=2818440 RepID=A0ABS3NKC6_9GAMM|nr:rhomboid family intramembrane serine protease [Psychrobacter coccoides]MBO1529803.1 rhomboid family intramembrane serine protease [Psychrobacter coccoides]